MYFSVLIGLLSIFLTVIVWKYLSYVIKYRHFPSYPMAMHLIYLFLTRQMPKDIPFTSFIFQEQLRICKTKPEGLCLFWFFEPFLFIYNEEAIKTFAHEQAATDKPDIYKILEVGFGKGLITSNGEKWRTDRRMLSPVFHIGKLKDITPIFNENAALLVNSLKATNGEPTEDLFDFLRLCAFRVFSESILGIQLIKEENLAQLKQLTEYLDKMSEFAMYKIHVPMYNWKYIMHIFPYVRKSLWYYKELNSFSEKVLNDLKEKAMKERDTKTVENKDEMIFGKNRKSFAEILLEMHLRDPSFTMRDVQDQINTFLVAGFDTVSFTLTWCLFLLGLHPEIQERAYQEVSQLPMNDIKYKDLHKITYLDCIIKETLRIYPTVPMYGRHLSKDVQCGKYLVPKNTSIIMFSYLWHRDPKYNPDPEKFNPDRFLESDVTKPSWAHIPFAEGIRSCLGKNYAMIEMKIILAHILQNLKVKSLNKREEVQVKWKVVLANTKPLQMQFSPRQS